MKVWTQVEYDEMKCGLNGICDLGMGDFRAVNFRRRDNIVIGADSKIGDGAHLGVRCTIGDGSVIGDNFRADGNLHIGKNCHFGANAHVDEDAIIERGCCFATGVEIGKNTELGEDVHLPRECGYLFDPGATLADGGSLMRLHPVAQRTICAFTAQWRGVQTVMIATQGVLMPLEDYVKRTRELMELGKAGSMHNLRDAQDLHAAAMFFKGHFERHALSA